MAQIYMFTSNPEPGRDFRMVSTREFFAKFGLAEAAEYLNTIRNRVRDEPRSDAEFFSAIRHIFCELARPEREAREAKLGPWADADPVPPWSW